MASRDIITCFFMFSPFSDMKLNPVLIRMGGIFLSSSSEKQAIGRARFSCLNVHGISSSMQVWKMHLEF